MCRRTIRHFACAYLAITYIYTLSRGSIWKRQRLYMYENHNYIVYYIIAESNDDYAAGDECFRFHRGDDDLKIREKIATPARSDRDSPGFNLSSRVHARRLVVYTYLQPIFG